ncbi:hypothetical protein CHS0354_027300 [Potamilus streckersoni]|nr:hypothetical protein CHS0354_027300 [Potamilus streckersoni]
MKGNDLLICQRRLEYLGQRLQDLAVEIGDGQGAVWFKQNLWFLNKPAEFIDDVLFGVGKICNHLSSYLHFKKQKIHTNFPLTTFVGILYDISDTLSIARDILLQHPEEKLSVKQSQIELFWKDCTPFLFIFEEKKCSFLRSEQVPTFLYALMDLVPTTIQVGLGLYCSSEPRFRGLDCFMETCLRLSKVLVDQGEFLTLADKMEPVLIPFLRQWVLYALEVLQNGVKTRMTRTESKENSNDNNQERQRPKTWSASSHEDQDDSEEYKTNSDSDAEKCLGPIKVYHSSRVRATCLPSRWLKVARTRMVCCPNELRKHCLEEAGLKENQKLVSNIYLATGPQHSSCKGIKLHCPLIKKYEDLSLRLFVKVKKGDVWRTAQTKWEQLYDKGQFLTFEEEFVEGFMAVEEIPMVVKEIGPKGGRLSTEYDKRIEAEIPNGVKRDISTVKMMIQPVDRPREQLYRESCPDVFHCIKSTSNAVEIDGAPSERDIAIKIPFDILKDSHTKILVLKYTNDHIEVRDASSLERGDGNLYTIPSRNGGTVLATVDPDVYGQNTSDSDIKREMEVILGKKQLCKLLIFVELQHDKLDFDNCVFQIVCAEKYRVDEVIKEKSKSGLVEIPKSQSSDRLLKQADDIKLEMKGSIQMDDDIPKEAYTLTYLEGSDNYLRFPVKLLDRNGRITFVLRHGKDDSILHTFFCPIATILELMSNTRPKSSSSRDSEASEGHDEVFLVDQDESELQRSLTEISISSSTESASQSSGQSVNQRDVENEAALKILARNSIVLLAKQMSGEEGHLLGVVLGMKPERINQIYKMYRHSGSLANFYILYEWRGRRVHPDQASQLVSGLQDIDRADLATIVTNVLKKNRTLSSTDFETENPKRKARR